LNLFNKKEFEKLENLQQKFLHNVSQLSENEYKNEQDRLAIDLSWKSSQIEGNTYSLLETEKLLKEKETASGKTKDEAVMLLNHKEALDFLIEFPDYFNEISVAKIENIHSILIKELGVSKNLRKRKVGISGTNYKPLDNEFQIREALEDLCKLINAKENIFEKTILALVIISYIQPFMDGNKRTARIVSNAILMNYNFCPLSFRTVDSIDYKKAMLIFYEQNNISAFKKIFIEQFEFAVNTYF
jgi:Fic family protein